MEVKIAAGAFGRARNCGWDGLQYHGWACSSAVSAWKQGILKRKCLSIKYPNVLAILSYFWLISPIVRHCTAYGGSNRSKEVRWENLLWHKHHSKHRLCHMARAGTSEHLNMLFFGKKYAFGGMFPRIICLSSLLSLLIMTQTPHFHTHGNRWTAGSNVINPITSLFVVFLCRNRNDRKNFCKWPFMQKGQR